MFYAHFVLAKKGPLARIWLAAHWDKKLTKAHVFETNIESSVEGILQPKVKMALRTSGHLLLGIVRIYSRKAKYLLADCNEAFIKIKMAFRPGVVDLPEENRQAEVAAITLPEVFHDFDSAMTDINLDMGPQTLNQSRVEDITIKEDFGPLNVIEEDFGMSFDDTEMFGTTSTITDFSAPIAPINQQEECAANSNEAREAAVDQVTMPEKEIEAALSETSNAAAPLQNDDSSQPSSNKASSNQMDTTLTHDGFGAPLGQGIIDHIDGDFLDAAGLFDEAPLGPPEPSRATTQDQSASEAVDKPPEESDDDDDYPDDMGPPSFGAPSPPTSPESTIMNEQPLAPTTEVGSEHSLHAPEVNPSPHLNDLPSAPQSLPEPAPPVDQTTLIHNEEESFALAPLDATTQPGFPGPEKGKSTKRKRKLIVDEVKNISGEEMKAQLSDTTDIVTTLDLAPPTKRLMHWKETGGVEKLFALPGKPILSKNLSRLYQRHLTTKSVENEDSVLDLDADLERSPKQARKKQKMDPIPHLPPPSVEPPYVAPSSMDQRPLTPQLSAPLETVPASMPPPPPVEQSSIHFPPIEPNIPPLPLDGAYSSAMNGSVPTLTNTSMNHSSIEMARASGSIDNSLMPPPYDTSSHLTLPHNGTIRAGSFETSDLPPDHAAAVLGYDLQPPSQIPAPPQDNLSLPTNAPLGIPRTLEESFFHPQDRLLSHQLPETSFQPETSLPSEVVPQSSSSLFPLAEEPASTLPLSQQQVPQQEEEEEEEPPARQETLQQPQPPPEDEATLIEPLTMDTKDQQEEAQQQNQFQQEEEDEEDYAPPASIGPPEEQLADETDEQFEERILTKRTTAMVHLLRAHLECGKGVANFSSILKNHTRKMVAQKFYTLLVLKKQRILELEQNEAYGDLFITKGPKFAL